VCAAGNLQVVTYDSPREMGLASAIAIAAEQCRLVAERGETSLQLMAAPSAFPFYEAYVGLARLSSELQQAIGRTHFFQFDDYLLPAHHQASFRFLLTHSLFGPLEDWYDASKVHFFEPDIGDPADACEAYTELLLEHGPYLMLKGQGEDGHWGFHQPGIPVEGEPEFITVEMNEMNVAQQMRDHPTLFREPEDVPSEAYTANVPLFMRTRELIETTFRRLPRPTPSWQPTRTMRWTTAARRAHSRATRRRSLAPPWTRAGR